MLHVLQKLLEQQQQFMSGLQLDDDAARFLSVLKLFNLITLNGFVNFPFFYLLLNSIQSATVWWCFIQSFHVEHGERAKLYQRTGIRLMILFDEIRPTCSLVLFLFVFLFVFFLIIHLWSLKRVSYITDQWIIPQSIKKLLGLFLFVFLFPM